MKRMSVSTTIIRLTHTNVNWEALQLHTVYKKPYLYYKSRENLYQYYKSCENPYQVVQVTCAASERAMKSLSP